MRHWIIGNGPSINQTPLELLKGEVTWGMNRPPIKPTYYYCLDVNERDHVWTHAVKENLDCKKVFLRDEWRGIFQGENITWIPICNKHHWYAADNYRKRSESWHLPSVCTAFGSMYVVMQLAVLAGATEICLVGCDLFTGKDDHYSPDYPEYVDQKERNVIETHIHLVAKRSSPVPIYNCGMGGMLDIHPRKDFFECLKEST